MFVSEMIGPLLPIKNLGVIVVPSMQSETHVVLSPATYWPIR